MKRIVLFSFLLAGCSSFQRCSASMRGELVERCSSAGVSYVLSPDGDGIAPSLDRDGKPVTCIP